ncbi:hypothetical protein A6D6_02397 [Alcanivorax xiamenensis]|uniref:DUF192 domain-containing protein n=1 Tax=Alcanivorax xiamenensis TaxID=1177156 RepID=A0ABQ6Y7K9_9GAMM|nr:MULTISPECIES: DUF192 domain-containing protein [Alcanivorax]KAF0805304.1 hypothetical protein A6D6_02397 [Alcanivorax xiamenensis]
MRASAIKWRQRGRRVGAVWLLSGLLAPAVAPAEQVTLCVEGVPRPIQVELASTREARTRGLMERDRLGEFEGMWFRYERPQPMANGFWMFNTRIPLDIAFLNPRGEILTIRTMAPCAHRESFACPVYRSDAPYASALEVNAGFFQRHGVAPGSRVGPAGDGNECAPAG